MALRHQTRGRDVGGGLTVVDLPEAAAPGRGEITVRLRASSLNYHDYRVMTVPGSVADGRIPMSDGVGVVEAVAMRVSG